jgi:uroporphyrinogen decarboxylase
MYSPDFNRVINTVKHMEPDRVPLVEAAISYEIMSMYLGKDVTVDDLKSQVEFWTKAGYDYIALTAGMMQPGKVTKDSFISKIIKQNVLKDNNLSGEEETWNLEKKAFIETEDDFESFPWEEAAKPDLDKFNAVQRYLPDGMKIVALSGKIFTLSWLLMGYENFCINLKLNPGFVKKIVTKVAEIQYEALCRVIEIPNVEALWAVDDLAFGTGTMISPIDFRKLIFPWYRKFAQKCHEDNKLLFFHSDGLLWDVMDDLIDIGVDALHPIDPTCMDIEEVKGKVGSKVCIFGNIPNDLLMAGTPHEVSELTKRRIAVLAPGGGYCVASGNSIPEWANIDNYKAMIDATHEHGVYPIKLL